MEVVEFGSLSDAQRAEVEGDEVDPFDAAGTTLSWRGKDRHVGLRAADGRLVASAGLVLTELRIGDRTVLPVVGIGGVIVAAPRRGQGLSSRLIGALLARAATLGPSVAILFCHRDRVGLYERHGFRELPAPVMVEQPDGFAEMPQVAMWRALRDGTNFPAGPVTLRGLPF